MQLGLFFTLFLASQAFGQSLQQKIEHSVLALYNEPQKPPVDVVSVERGYLMSSSGLKEYVQVKDEKFNAEMPGQTQNDKTTFGGLQKIFDTFVRLKQKAQQSLTAEKIEKQKALPQASIQTAYALKSILASYRMASPFKITSDNVCSMKGAKLEGYYKQEKFSLSQENLKSTTEDKAHATQIEFKKTKATEAENYVQTGSYQLGVYETSKYQIAEGGKVVGLNKAKHNSEMLDQFVTDHVGADKTTNITKADLPVLKKELQKSWLLLKRVGACCNEAACKQALVSNSSNSSSGKALDTGGLAPYVR